jgi:hypothetical protein
MKKNDAILFGAGIPTAPDVKRICQEVGTPAAGTFISYAALEKAIGCVRTSNRWKTVVQAWRLQLHREHNLLLGAEPGKGFIVLDNSARVHVAGAKYKNSMRGIRRSSEIASSTAVDGLTSAEMKARDHIVNAAATLQLASATAAKRLRLPQPNGSN